MILRRFALFNMGRDKDESKSTWKLDANAIDEAVELVGQHRAAIFWCEVNEGDDNDELALIRRRLPKGWATYAGDPRRPIREPVSLSPDQPPYRWTVRWVPNTSVPHWSPLRSVLRLHDPENPHSLAAWHNAAGPHTAGDRPERYRQALADSWDASQYAGQQAKRSLHRRRRNVTQFSDLNHYHLRPMHDERLVVHHATDYGFAYPADGWIASTREGRSRSGGIDSHHILTMEVVYRREHQ